MLHSLSTEQSADNSAKPSSQQTTLQNLGAMRRMKTITHKSNFLTLKVQAPAKTLCFTFGKLLEKAVTASLNNLANQTIETPAIAKQALRDI